MNEDKMKILEMVSEGIITAQEGADLLSALGEKEEQEVVYNVKKDAPFKMIRIRVLSADGDKVNVQLPVQFAKIAFEASKNYGGVDISGLDIDFDEIISMVDAGVMGKIVDITSADGDVVEISVE